LAIGSWLFEVAILTRISNQKKLNFYKKHPILHFSLFHHLALFTSSLALFTFSLALLPYAHP
jgi:hypothetical protein